MKIHGISQNCFKLIKKQTRIFDSDRQTDGQTDMQIDTGDGGQYVFSRGRRWTKLQNQENTEHILYSPIFPKFRPQGYKLLYISECNVMQISRGSYLKFKQHMILLIWTCFRSIDNGFKQIYEWVTMQEWQFETCCHGRKSG